MTSDQAQTPTTSASSCLCPTCAPGGPHAYVLVATMGQDAARTQRPPRGSTYREDPPRTRERCAACGLVRTGLWYDRDEFAHHDHHMNGAYLSVAPPCSGATPVKPANEQRGDETT